MTAAAAAVDARTIGTRPATTSAAATETRPAAPSVPPHPTLATLAGFLNAMYAVVGAAPPAPWWTAMETPAPGPDAR